jgi:hypothetical protein
MPCTKRQSKIERPAPRNHIPAGDLIDNIYPILAILLIYQDIFGPKQARLAKTDR